MPNATAAAAGTVSNAAVEYFVSCAEVSARTLSDGALPLITCLPRELSWPCSMTLQRRTKLLPRTNESPDPVSPDGQHRVPLPTECAFHARLLHDAHKRDSPVAQHSWKE